MVHLKQLFFLIDIGHYLLILFFYLGNIIIETFDLVPCVLKFLMELLLFLLDGQVIGLELIALFF